jgi:hypothetical protein
MASHRQGEMGMDRVTLLERRCLRLTYLQALLGAAFVAYVGWTHWETPAAAQESPQAITVSSIDVVDPAGTVRVRIGGALSAEVRNGKRIQRPPLAGVLLFDETGRERSGYVTFPAEGDEAAPVVLTLDTPERQSVLFAAQGEGAALKIWHEKNIFDLRVDGDGPSLHMMQDGEAAFHEPPEQEPETSGWCRKLRDALGRARAEEVRTACENRHSAAACSACLE